MSAADQVDERIDAQQPATAPSWRRLSFGGLMPVFFTLFGAIASLTIISIALAEAHPNPLAVIFPMLPPALGITMLLIRVTIDGSGVRVASGILRFRLKHIPLERIASAEVGFLDPNSWSGAGWPKPRGHSGIVLRWRDGLILNLADGKRFAVSTRDPASAAAFLTALLEQDAATAS